MPVLFLGKTDIRRIRKSRSFFVNKFFITIYLFSLGSLSIAYQYS